MSSQVIIRTARPEELQVEIPERLREWKTPDPAYRQALIPVQVLEQWISTIPGGEESIVAVANQRGITFDKRQPGFNVEQWYHLLSEWVHHMVNTKLEGTYDLLDQIVEENRARAMIQQAAVQELEKKLEWVTGELQQYAERWAASVGTEEMDWQPTQQIDIIDFRAELQRAIEQHSLTLRSTRADSKQPAAQPVLAKGLHPVSARRASPGPSTRRRSASPSQDPSELRQTPGRSRQGTPTTKSAQMEARLMASMDSKFEKLFKKLERNLTSWQNTVINGVAGLETRLDGLEGRLAALPASRPSSPHQEIRTTSPL